MHKDIRPAIHQAHQRGVVVPSTAAEDDILATATQLGEVQRDIAGLREVLAKISDKPGA
jgi:3-hydroxyisobutyrate dehydrogenase-like beta-hydroxyacid dehydrogenase